MPWKSDAQRKYMSMAAAKGKVPQSVVDEGNAASKGMKLPQRADVSGGKGLLNRIYKKAVRNVGI